MKRKTVDIYFMICSGNVDWTWREQADLVKWTRVSVTPNFYSSNLTTREIETLYMYMKLMCFYKLNIMVLLFSI